MSHDLQSIAPAVEGVKPNGPGHFVQFYDEDSFLLDAVTRFIGTSLADGDAGIVIATKPHRDALAERLSASDLDLTSVTERGCYVPLDATETLSKFMVDGWPDERRFRDVVGSVIARVAGAGHRPRVRAFGEMVALLCADGMPDAAIRLEELWNDLGKRLACSLLCAYPMSTFRRNAHGRPLSTICAQHSRVIPAESYTALTTTEDRLRTITLLQQKARALEAEVAQRKQAETALQRKREELNENLEQLAETDRRKDEFLAMLGHELRNPLSAVRNAIVTARLDPPRRERALDIARRQADQLARLVDDLLDVARITQGRITLRKRPISFAGVVERAVETTRQLVEERAHALALVLPAEDLWVEVDPTRLEQVVVNLISNAAKYTEPGGRIEVAAERRGDEVVLRVRDNGIGIAPEMLPRVFDLFAQAEPSLDRAQGGLGIGLTVVRRLVELHGGRVEVESEQGQGAEFRVFLPGLPVRPEEMVPASTAAEGHAARLLIVEDNTDAAESLMMLLELLGHRVRVVHDGVAALEAATANVPDVMLIDIGLPGIDGYEVARRIRREPGLERVVLVALTGYGREGDKKQALAAGFDYHLAKPVNPDTLQDLVARLGSAEAGRPQSGLH